MLFISLKINKIRVMRYFKIKIWKILTGRKRYGIFAYYNCFEHRSFTVHKLSLVSRGRFFRKRRKSPTIREEDVYVYCDEQESGDSLIINLQSANEDY